MWRRSRPVVGPIDFVVRGLARQAPQDNYNESANNSAWLAGNHGGPLDKYMGRPLTVKCKLREWLTRMSFGITAWWLLESATWMPSSGFRSPLNGLTHMGAHF